jgi:hypothetical protein
VLRFYPVAMPAHTRGSRGSLPGLKRRGAMVGSTCRAALSRYSRSTSSSSATVGAAGIGVFLCTLGDIPQKHARILRWFACIFENARTKRL